MITDSAALILLRPKARGFDTFLLRRDGGVWSLPSGAVHPGEDGRVAAARVAFEDCGVLLARDAGQAETLEMPNLFALRKKVRGGANATEVLRSVGLTWSNDALMTWSHWITPSGEVARQSLRIFVGEIPPGMLPTFDKTEPVEQLWLRAAEARTRAGELALNPALVRTFYELERYDSVASVLAAARTRAEEPHPILPRIATNAASTLLLPWDPEYETAGQGESLPLAYQPKWARGASRFVLEDRTWKHVAAPGSTNAG